MGQGGRHRERAARKRSGSGVGQEVDKERNAEGTPGEQMCGNEQLGRGER